MIPKNFVDEYLEKAKGCRLFDTPIEQLSRDELIACCAAGWDAEKQARETASKERNFLFSLMRR